MNVRIERDRHFECTPGRCVAPVPSARRLRGRPVGACHPRRVYWLRVNRGGRREAVAFKTKDEAIMAMEKVRAAAVLGQDYQPKVTTPAAPTFAVVAKEALQLYSQLMKPRASTRRNHEGFLRRHLLQQFGTKPVTPETFSPLALQRFILSKQGTLSDASIKVSLPTLRLVLDHAVRLGLLPANPLRSGERLWKSLPPTETVDPFTSGELRALLKAARTISADFAVLLQVMMQTGIRPGEALGLRRCDVNLSTAMVSVRGSYSRHRMGPTKTRQSVRTVSLLYPTTEDRSEWMPKASGIATQRVLDGLAVLVATTADAEARCWPMGADQFSRLWTKTCQKAGVRRRKPHALRHSFASILLSRGANLLAITKAGGWATATTLLKVYAKWIEEDSASTAASSEASPEFFERASLTV